MSSSGRAALAFGRIGPIMIAMRHAHLFGSVLLTTCVLLLAGCGEDGAPTGAAPPDARRYVIVSGGQSGVYYPTASAIARLAGQADPNLMLDVQTSGGSVANARMIGFGDADLATMQNDIASYARHGTEMFSASTAGRAGIDNLVGVAALYPEHIQVVARADSGVGTIADLEGKAVAIGAIGSGTEANARQILAAYGLSEADLGRVERLSASQSRQYLQDKRVDAAFFTFGVGTAAIQELALVSRIKLIPVDGEPRRRLLDRYEFYSEAVVPAGSYRGVESDVPTVSVTATLVARAQVPADVIDAVLRGVFDHLDQFQATHARLKQVNRADAAAKLTLPMHDAAEAYFQAP